MFRLFVGLRPPPALRDLLCDTMEGVTGARWQDDGQLHVTLRFIGEVDGRIADDAALAVTAVVAPAPTLRLDGVNAFRTRGRPHALWAGLAPPEPLADLHRKVDQALVRIGLPPERRAYLPHITLARLNAASGPADRWLAGHAALTSPAFTIPQMTLFESRLGHGGADYLEIVSVPLLR